MMLPADIRQDLAYSRSLLSDVDALAACGGRFAGSASEARARDWLLQRLSAIPGARVGQHVFEYDGWRQRVARLVTLERPQRTVSCHALIWSPSTPPGGIEANVVDLGRGSPDDFDRAGAQLKGRIALVRHEYPFASDTIHRRVKYARSVQEGAAAFVIANNLPDAGLVTGSSGAGGPDDIPAVGVSDETASLLAAQSSDGTPVRLEVATERIPGRGANLVVDIPGAEPEWVLVTAHYDGHDLAESALDNATGTAAVIGIVEALARRVADVRRGLRAVLFTTEEWRLLGSQLYTDQLSTAERRAIAAVINLDTLAGSPRLACLTSGFADLDDFARDVAIDTDVDVEIVPRLLRNSDHFNFARLGIPALRLVAGFGDPEARTRYLLTSGDTRDKMMPGELQNAAVVAAALVWAALTTRRTIAPHKTAAEMSQLL